MAKYGRMQVDSFSTWHSGTGVDVNRESGDIFVIHDGGLIRYRKDGGNYARQSVMAPLKTRVGAACVSLNHASAEVAVVHERGLNVYQPSGSVYKELVLDVFQGITTKARAVFHRASGDLYVISNAGGLYVLRKNRSGYEKMLIDGFGAWHSSSGIGVDQSTGDIFVVANHVGGGRGPYPVDTSIPEPDHWPKGDCLVRYRPCGNYRYIKMIVDWPVATLGGADLDVNTDTGEIIVIADPGLYIYQQDQDKYIRHTVGATYSRGEGAAVKVNEQNGEIYEVADSHIRVFTNTNNGEPIDAAMTRSCGVDVTCNTATGEIIMVDNRGLTIYSKS